MYRSKLGTMVAILATAAGFSALAGPAEAQISGTIGGDIVDNGNVAFQWGHVKTNSWLIGRELNDIPVDMEATAAPYVNREAGHQRQTDHQGLERHLPQPARRLPDDPR
jgi:hypothetical protein